MLKKGCTKQKYEYRQMECFRTTILTSSEGNKMNTNNYDIELELY